jgi:DNA-binding response OmpR family regulator
MNSKPKLRKKVLIIEDDKSLSLVIQRELNYMGYEAQGALDGQTGLDLAVKNDYSLIISDVSLPKLSGFSILQKLKSLNIKTPIMIITNYSINENEIIAYSNGANLFHRKPINYELFRAQIRMLVETYKFEPNITIGDIFIDPNKKVFKKAGKTIKLSKKEYGVMLILVSSPGTVFNRKELMGVGSGFSRINAEESSIDTLMSRLRKKVGKYKDTDVVETIYSEGYRLNLAYLE